MEPSNTNPKKNPKKTPKKTSNENDNENDNVNEIYKELELKEHILLRPDSYVGGVDIITIKEWVPNDISDESTLNDIKSYIYKDVTYCPAALKIFDEIIVNARDAGIRDKGVTWIRIDIDRPTGAITVTNNSTYGIPIERMNSGDYVPESIFGKLLSGQNFNDYEGRITGGRNGYGGKLTNIYSTEFSIDCTDTQRHLRFQQTFSNNMSDKTKPLVTKYSKSEAYVKIRFVPDFQKLGGCKNIDDDLYRLLIKRTYDIAACTPEHVKILLNGKQLKIRNFERYVNLFLNRSDVNGNNEENPKDQNPKDQNNAGNDNVKNKFVYLKLKNQITEKEIQTLCQRNQEERKKKGHRDSEQPFQFKDVKVQDIEWEIAVSLSDGSFNQTSFVNGIYTPEGGEHITYIRNKLVKGISDYIKNIKKKTIDKTEYIRNNLWIFVNAVVINPSFGGQTKRQMTLEAANFFYKCKIPDEFIESLEKKCKITARVLRVSEAIEIEKFEGGSKNRKLKKIKGLPKLQDAQWAGDPKKSSECTLIVTEGDSAKTFALSGLNVVGNDRYGVFPLRGKPINVGEKSIKQIKENEEYQNLLKILGLNEGDKLDSVVNMRYNSIMIMSDQDLDGYHIKLLLMNMFKERFPEIFLKHPGFIQCFITPIVTATARTGKKNKILFFSIQDFEKWKLTNPQSLYDIKYLKGLGTSTKEDAISYFENKDLHIKEYFCNDVDPSDAPLIAPSDAPLIAPSDAPLNSHSDQTVPKTMEMFDIAFAKKKIAERKNWLLNYNEKDVLDYSQPRFSYVDAINKELKHFSTYSYRRAIPNICDGLKTVQRKIIWHLIQTKLWNKSKKVAQIKGSVADKADYHHGENALSDAIINLAQNYPGSNNLNLLVPEGQFGSLLMKGEDASADRYIFTRLEPVARSLFDERDDCLLQYQLDDNEKPVEPTHYITTLPLVLVNGVAGIGTGFSTNMPSFNPLDLIDRLRILITLSEKSSIDTNNNISINHIKPLIPWFREFKGTIDRNLEDTYYVAVGNWRRLDKTKIIVTELPLGHGSLSFQKYKEWLEKHLMENETKADKQKRSLSSRKSSDRQKSNKEKSSVKVTSDKYFIKDYEDRLTDTNCEFIITFKDESTLDGFIRRSGKVHDYAFERTMQLVCNIQYTNMMLFDENDKLMQFHTPEAILLHFFHLRLDKYRQRKEHIIRQYEFEAAKISEKVRYLEMVNDGKIKILKQSKAFVIEQLKANHFRGFPSKAFSSSNNDESKNDGSNNDESNNEGSKNDDFIGILGGAAVEANALSLTNTTNTNTLTISTNNTNNEVIEDQYRYLTSLPNSCFTIEKVNELNSEKEKSLAYLEILKSTSYQQLWRQDLAQLETEIKLQNEIVHDQQNYDRTEKKSKQTSKQKGNVNKKQRK